MALSEIFRRNRTLKYAAPFFVLVGGGSLLLKQYQQVRYDHRAQKRLTPQEAEVFGVHMKKKEEVTMEKEFQSIKSMDIDTWENKRGPRPWES